MTFATSTPFKKSILALVGAACLGAASLAHADTTLTDNFTLADLVINKRSFTVGDKEFSNFDWHANGFFNDATGQLWGDLDLAAHINVHGEITNSGNYGLDFTGPLQAHPGDSASAQLTYTVRVLNPNFYLSDFHLDGDPLVSGANGQAVVRESVSDLTNTLIPLNPVGPLEVSQYVPGASVFNDVAFTQPGLRPTVAEIETTLLLSATIPGTNASVLHFQESFSQAVPEPSTYALALVGIAALGFARRRTADLAA
ncbi:PEP-CTERM sorting domain-containing protein [Aquabacterium sp.]|uniref:PEP-CTERM sorting domain-containing protein n=1 Tax=Aquabacterium sp. TaxID=1872578 RepID=UPI002489D0BD|nr:PEP-CTERM sorting domain-containing protein [Aquabacterium sp.]MDI1349219.1 PEP-CTERM sorting domain-containing protein [Aquabacterium sp.]